MNNPSVDVRGKRRTYRFIAESLIDRIESSQVLAGSYLPTEKDLQIEFGVTRTTVRRALAAVVDAGYGESVPNKGVVAVQRNQSKAKAVAFIDGATIVLRAMFKHMSSNLLQRDIHMVHVDSESIGVEHALQFAMTKGFDGAFIWPFEGFPDAEFVGKCCDSMPVVALDHCLRGVETDLVTFNYFEMARSMTESVIQAGRRRIAVTGMLDMLEVTHDRFSGYMHALLANRITPNPLHYGFCFTSNAVAVDYTHLKTAFQSADRPDAVFVMQDMFLPGAIEVAMDCGLRVPQDVAFYTIGDDTTVHIDGQGILAAHCDWAAFSSMAIELLVSRIASPKAEKRTLLAPFDIVNESELDSIDAPEQDDRRQSIAVSYLNKFSNPGSTKAPSPTRSSLQ